MCHGYKTSVMFAGNQYKLIIKSVSDKFMHTCTCVECTSTYVFYKN